MTFVIRQALPSDASAVLEHLKAVVETSLYIPKSLEEITLTVIEEEKALQWFLDSPNSLFLVALDGDKVVGNLDLKGYQRKAFEHMAELGMGIQSPYRGAGLGFRLLDEALAWAKANSLLKRINLNVYSENEPAIKLYQKFGFQLEGQRAQFIYQNGRYYTDLVMGLILPGKTGGDGAKPRPDLH